jgi:hypothetical protein
MDKYRFSWAVHGPADFAAAAGVIASLSAEDRQQLNGTERAALERILDLFAKHARQGGKAAYLTFSRSWLASVLRRSVRQVARILKRLVELGYLVRVRRKPVHAVPQTDLTLPGNRLLSLVYRTAKILQRNRKGTKMSHNDLKKGIGVVTSTVTTTPIQQNEAERGLERRPYAPAWAAEPRGQVKKEQWEALYAELKRKLVAQKAG